VDGIEIVGPRAFDIRFRWHADRPLREQYQVFVHLVLGGYQVVTVGNPVKADLLAELCQFHHLVHFHECE